MDRNSLCGSRRDWPMLDRAIKKKIAELCAFVEWWQKTVSPARGGDRAINQMPRSDLSFGADGAVGLTSEQICADVERTAPSAPINGCLRRYFY